MGWRITIRVPNETRPALDSQGGCPKRSDHVIYRYPLAAAIADAYVKTLVVVGRKVDRSDPLTQLNDGELLLEGNTESSSPPE